MVSDELKGSCFKFRLVNAPEANVSLLATVPATNRLLTPAVIANVGTLQKGWVRSRILRIKSPGGPIVGRKNYIL